METLLTKDIFGSFKIPPPNLKGVYGPREIKKDGISDKKVKEAIQSPLGIEPIRRVAKGCRDVLIITDDITRPTPLYRLIPPVLEELKLAGVSDENINFLIGLGTHRPMSESEIREKFGEEISSKYEIINHEWNNPEALVSLGKCGLGFEVTVNKLVLETDFLISIGSIVPHATTGFSGGGKTLMTGVAGEKTIENTHWMALDYSMNEILGNYDNQVRKTIDSLAERLKLRMIINTVLFNDDDVYSIVAGDLKSTYKKGVDFCREVYGVEVRRKTDIVIAEAYPADFNLRQSIKAICSADLVCRDNGVIILPAECSEGIASQFPEFSEYGFKEPEKVYDKVLSGEFKQKIMAYTLVAIGRIISKRVKAILVSPNITKTQAEKMGFLWEANMQDAVDKAFEICGNNAEVAILKKASVTLPMVNTTE